MMLLISLAACLFPAYVIFPVVNGQDGNFEENFENENYFDYQRERHQPYYNQQRRLYNRNVPRREMGREGNVPILKQINRYNEDGSYTYGFEGADGSFKVETKSPEGVVSGKYGYVDDEGKVRVVEYGADRDGFKPYGEGINVPAPESSRPSRYHSIPGNRIGQRGNPATDDEGGAAASSNRRSFVSDLREWRLPRLRDDGQQIAATVQYDSGRRSYPVYRPAASAPAAATTSERNVGGRGERAFRAKAVVVSASGLPDSSQGGSEVKRFFVKTNGDTILDHLIKRYAGSDTVPNLSVNLP